MVRIFQSISNGVLTAHTEWLPGVQLRHSVPQGRSHQIWSGQVGSASARTHTLGVPGGMPPPEKF